MSSKLDLDAARRVCEVVAGGRLLPGSSVAEVHARGVRVVLAFRLNAAEVERRQEAGVEPVLDRSALEGLMQLPAGLPVPSSVLTARERSLLRRCPQHAVERRDGGLVRRLVTPLEVDLAVVRASRPARGALVRAGRFGAYTTSAVWLDGPAAGSELLVMEAGVYGLGAVRGQAGEAPELLVAPRSSSRFGHTSAGWLFTEQVYAQLLQASDVISLLPQPTR
ncbi:hypothetical protein OHO83_10645 [Streptomyces sp. NBC_00569]|uniref:hypothetical protein n=1 Tax=Streptomyces sp. NBC_00569 TaxID=2975780 RepID=UPI002E80898A|nr:hypothetical protein [Streptomyces sp. NBC_00569]WUB92721.1 hypothetical protein OHO83_10645 [Streptomyces sp. NBC_00569]